MNDFLRRIRRLEKQIQFKEQPMAVLTYGGGTVREMGWMDAFLEIGGGADVIAVQYSEDETGESLLVAMLPGIENVKYEELEELHERHYS